MEKWNRCLRIGDAPRGSREGVSTEGERAGTDHLHHIQEEAQAIIGRAVAVLANGNFRPAA